MKLTDTMILDKKQIYTCFKKGAHITWLDKDRTYRSKEEILDGWYVADEKNNVIEATSSSFISLWEYRKNKISDILK